MRYAMAHVDIELVSYAALQAFGVSANEAGCAALTERATADLKIGQAIKNVFLTPPDPDFDSDPQRMEASAKLGNATDLDLSAFRDAGSKMLLYHGTGDATISANDTAHYMWDVTDRMGPESAAFIRHFPVPGMTHCRGGVGADEFSVLDTVVTRIEQGEASERLIASGPAIGDRTRPLCQWSTVARYDGTGPVDDAASLISE